MAIETPREPPQQQEPPQDYKNAKAQAKAAKAYAKAQRPWYKKKRYILAIGVVLLIAIIVTASSGGGGSTTPSGSDDADTGAAPTAQATESKTEAPATTGATAKLPIQNGDWRLDSIRVKDDGLGDFGGTARVTYTGENPEGGSNIFTLTVFVRGKDVAALTGSADSVMPGRAATVQFVSGDKFIAGPYKYDFQNDF